MEKLMIIDQEKFDSSKMSALVIVKCPICNNVFERRKNYILRNKTSFCSKKCSCDFRAKTCLKPCANCNKSFIISQSRIKRSKNVFCSVSCKNKLNKPPKNKKPTIHIDQCEYLKLPILINIEQFNILKTDDLVDMKCKKCNKEFKQNKNTILRSLKKHGTSGYCSKNCSNKSKINSISTKCTECLKHVVVNPSRIKKAKNIFCSLSCSAKHRNKNKNFGNIRSKMEIFIESKLKSTYPNIDVIFNDRTILNGLEIDFFFPSLKLAIELNGITHYEPIYGLDRLIRSQDSDKRKMILCYEKGIELAVIDISSIKYFKEKNGLKIFDEFQKILSPLCS